MSTVLLRRSLQKPNSRVMGTGIAKHLVLEEELVVRNSIY